MQAALSAGKRSCRAVDQLPLCRATSRCCAALHIIQTRLKPASACLPHTALPVFVQLAEHMLVAQMMYGHTRMMRSNVQSVCVQLKFPVKAVVPEPLDALVMVFVGASSFFGQLLLGRGYQLELASKVAAVNYLQVGKIISIPMPECKSGAAILLATICMTVMSVHQPLLTTQFAEAVIQQTTSACTVQHSI